MKRSRSAIKAYNKHLKEENRILKNAIRKEREARDWDYKQMHLELESQKHNEKVVTLALKNEIKALEDVIDRYRGRKWYQFIPIRKK